MKTRRLSGGLGLRGAATVAGCAFAGVMLASSCSGNEGVSGGVAGAGSGSGAGSGGGSTVSVSVSTPGWAAWTKQIKPIHAGPFGLVGDPSVIRDGSLLRMFYTCYDPSRSPQGPAICQATSTDGQAWADVATTVNRAVAGQMLMPGKKWDTAHETALIVKFRGEYLLYFSGYVDKGGFMNSFPAQLGLAVSTDGVNFTRHGDAPVLAPTPGGYDNDAVFSPTIVEHDGQLVMLYTGHCWNDCPKGAGLYLLAATSADGRSWVKREAVVMSKAHTPNAKDGVAETELVKGPDGMFYLFVSLMQGDAGHDIGIARSASPFGPWELDPEPIVRRTAGEFDEVGPIAPSVLIEGGRVRMWFHGFDKKNQIRIGYAEAPWPLVTK